MGLVIANFMDSSLADLQAKGVFAAVPGIYNPGGAYERVIHFTPHERDRNLADALAPHRIDLVVHDVSGMQPIKMVRTLFRVWQLLGRERVDLVRGRLPYLGSLIGGLAARLRGLPFVVSLGGDNRIGQERSNSYYLGHRWLSYGIEALVLRLATRIIVTNQFTADYVARIIGADGARRKCALVPWISPPVDDNDPADAARLAALDLDTEAVVVPVIGFVNRYKFSDVLFAAFESGPLRARDGRRVIICFAGDGPLLAEGRARFAGRDDVRFLGWQPREAVHALLRRADVVLIPMSGFVLLEAASLGKIVIASAAEWHGEVVRDGQTGYLVDPLDPQAWRRTLARAIDDIEIGHAMGRRLKDVYVSRLSPQAAIAAEHELYEVLTSRKAAG